MEPVSTEGLDHWLGDDEDGEEAAAAAEIWSKLRDRAKALFAVLAREPGRKFSARELADALSIPNGMYGVAGVLAWPARHALAVGYKQPVEYQDGPIGEGANYWMPAEAADSFRKVMPP